MIKTILKKLFNKPYNNLIYYMVVGFRWFPVNPNDYLPTWTERDNPFMFSSKEEAKRFIEEARNSGDMNITTDASEFIVVKVKKVA